jgi:hypothetical protein
VYKKFSNNALNYGGGPSFRTAQFSADLEKFEVVSSRDELGLVGLVAPRLGGVPGVPGMPTPRPRRVPGHAGTRAQVSTGGFEVDSSPLVPGAGPALGTV